LTDELEQRATEYIKAIDGMGGMLPAIESGYVQREIQEAAYKYQRALEEKEEIVVGLNEFLEDEETEIEIQRIDPAVEAAQHERLAHLRATRDNNKVAELRSQLTSAAQSSDNMMPLFITCVENNVTLGEICHTLRETWGEYRPGYEF
jgi:methylmalonyl-CoA mutase N-terminal domain/subunit